MVSCKTVLMLLHSYHPLFHLENVIFVRFHFSSEYLYFVHVQQTRGIVAVQLFGQLFKMLQI